MGLTEYSNTIYGRGIKYDPKAVRKMNGTRLHYLMSERSGMMIKFEYFVSLGASGRQFRQAKLKSHSPQMR